jgi:putative Mg2+ transporter-C (MgtC) family protein
MLTNPSWPEIALRLGLAALAGVLVGYNREARSQAAGLRTTTLVCVSACLSMVLANLLLVTDGPDPRSFIRLDVMRLPLGVLTGIGFIGAGAIVRRGDAVIGVATAATLWFMTLVGFAFGAGHPALGGAVTVVGLVLLSALERADHVISRRFRSGLTVSADPAHLPEDELRALLTERGQRIVAWAVTYRDSGDSYEVRAELEWHGRPRDRAAPPDFLRGLAARPGVRTLDWAPQAISA